MKYAFSKKFDLCNKSCLMRKDSGNPAREEFLRRTDEAAAWEQKFDLLGEHYRRWLPHCSLQEVLTMLQTTIMVMRNF